MTSESPAEKRTLKQRAAEPVTQAQLVGWVLAGAVAFIFGALSFGTSIVGRAEAASGRSEDRIERRLVRIEEKVDRLLGGP